MPEPQSAEELARLAAEAAADKLAAQLSQNLTDDIVRQLKHGNGRSTEKTEGMTIRELVLEVREDVKELQKHAPSWVTRREVMAGGGAIAGLVLTAIKIFHI